MVNGTLDTAIPAGPIKLNFVSRVGGNCRSLLVAFHLGDETEGRIIHANESELLAFVRFQKRCLETGAGFPEHEATKTPAGRRQWDADVTAAIHAGQTVNLRACPGYRLIGGAR